MTHSQIASIAAGIQSGLGADDIALKLDLSPDHVRMQVRRFRAQGVLQAMADEARHRMVGDLRKRGLVV